MSRPRFSYLPVVLTALAALPACDAQVKPDYQGDPLLRIRGAVVIPEGFEGEDLVPVIAFDAASQELRARGSLYYDHERILDVSVDGDFPSSFSLDVFDPPPAEALLRLVPGQPEYAIGSVSAMPSAHPEAIRSIYAIDHSAPAETHYESSRKRCTLDETECFAETFDCPLLPVTSLDDCTLTSTSGAPALAVAGYSQNYLVAYFPEPVQRDSYLSFAFGAGSPLDAGYHLFEMIPYGEEPLPPQPEPPGCNEDLSAIAAAEYNVTHGTALTMQDFQLNQMEPYHYDWTALTWTLARDRGCYLSTSGKVRIPDPSQTSISIELGAREPLYLH